LEVQASEALGVSPYELMNLGAEKSPVGANGLLYLPYLMGERSRRWNPRARGAFIGLTIRHTRADMVRAVLEGVTMNLKVILDALSHAGCADRSHAGHRRGRARAILESDDGKYLRNADSPPGDSGRRDLDGRGACGWCRCQSLPGFSMIEAMNEISEVIEPSPHGQAAYERIYPIFEAAYHALVPIYDRIAEL
jgi:xylulokinase